MTGQKKNTTIAFVFILLLCAVATGCASGGGLYQLNLMPAPDVQDDGNIDPFIDDDPIGRESQPDNILCSCGANRLSPVRS